MFKKKFLVLIFLAIFALISYTCENAAASNNLVLSNDFFSFTMPEETKGTYDVEKEDNGIFIIEKTSKKEQMGGYAFGIKIYKNPEDYADMPGSKKLGELTDKNGVLYDMVLERPSDVMYADGEEVAKNYDRLYEAGNNVEIKGINGSEYTKGKGMKGEELYGKIVEKYKESKDMSKKVGYVFYDINSDGIDELLVGENAKGKDKGMIYYVYTVVNRKPQLVYANTEGYEKVFVCNSTFLCKEHISGSKQYHLDVVFFDPNSKELKRHVKYVYDAIAKPKDPYWVDKGYFGTQGGLSKKEFYSKVDMYKDFERFDFIPFKTGK